MKLIELLNIKKAIEPNTQKKLPFALSYKLYKLVKRAEEEAAFYREKLQAIIADYAKKDENGKPIEADGFFNITEDKQEEFSKAIKELNEIEVNGAELEVKFTPAELSALELSVADMDALQIVIEG